MKFSMNSNEIRFIHIEMLRNCYPIEEIRFFVVKSYFVTFIFLYVIYRILSDAYERFETEDDDYKQMQK